MSSREAILGKLKSQLEAQKPQAERVKSSKARLSKNARGVTLNFETNKKNLLKRFIEMAEAVNATTAVVTAKNVGAEVQRYLREHNLPTQIKCGEDSRLEDLINSTQKQITYSKGRSDGSDLVGLSHAACAIAETGTLALTSGKENPTTVNFLPENHLVLVNQKDIVAHYEDLWEMIEKQYGANKMPRTVNLITGPSRSADIEQKLILGAHGPVRLHIMLQSG